MNDWSAELQTKAPGVQPILYMNQNYAEHLAGLTGYPLWIAAPNNDPNYTPNTGPWSSWAVMQYSQSGSVSGVTPNVDLDVLNSSTSLTSLEIGASAAVSFDWNMAPRTVADANGNIDVINDNSYVDPGTFGVYFHGHSSLSGGSATSYAMNITGFDGVTYPATFVTPEPGGFFASLPQGYYHVTLTASNGNETATATQVIQVRDFLIVAVGDSYSSGEGNPEVNRSTLLGLETAPAQWMQTGQLGQELVNQGLLSSAANDELNRENQISHRSSVAATAQMALRLENADPHTSVTFVFVSASGATINQGGLSSYLGLGDEADPSKPMLSQLEQVRRVIGNRTVDAMTVSFGGNDVGFARIAKALVMAGPNQFTDSFKADFKNAIDSGTQGDWQKVQTDVNYLGFGLSDEDTQPILGLDHLINGRDDVSADGQTLGQIEGFAALNAVIQELHPSHVYATEYPNSTISGRNSNGELTYYPAILQDAVPLPGNWEIDSTEEQWITDNLVNPLNSKIRSFAQSVGWSYVGGISDAFVGHGYGAADADRWIVTATESEANQGDTTGTLHPNSAGHREIASISLNAMTTTVVSSSAAPSVLGQAATLTATVSVGAIAPSGTVTFLDGTTKLGTSPLDGGVATLATSSLPAGGRAISAVYNSDDNFWTSTSAPFSLMVGPNTTTTLASSANPSSLGSSVTFTATVTAVSPMTGTPTGVVTLMDGTKPLTTAPLPLQGGVVVFSTSALTARSHNISAVYGGDANFTNSTSATLTQLVNPAGTYVQIADAGHTLVVTSTTYVLDGTDYTYSGSQNLTIDTGNVTATIAIQGGSTGISVTMSGNGSLSGASLTASESSTINVAGNWSNHGYFMVTASGGAVANLQGTLNNDGGTLSLAGGGAINLQGTIQGGTVTSADGTRLCGQGGTLDYVTVQTDIDLAKYNGSCLYIVNGLILSNATAYVGNAAGLTYGRLFFTNTETLGGTGTILFGKSGANGLYTQGNVMLTISTGIKVLGSNGTVGNWNGNGVIVNQGTISADDSGGASSFAYDSGFSGGGTGNTADAIDTSGVSNPAPAVVYETWCAGSAFSYALTNLTAGASYTVRLHFAEPSYNNAWQRQFNVRINNAPVLTNFDIVAAAGDGTRRW